MYSHLPLDDQLNRVFYFEDALWRLVYAPALGRCVLRREAPYVAIEEAVAQVAAGELLWAPPESFEQLGARTLPETVQQEHDLLCAFLRSPAGRRLPRWGMRTRLEGRISDDRTWLMRRAHIRGEAPPEAQG